MTDRIDAAGTPDAEIEIDTALVYSLLQQHPDLLDLPIQFLESGWDNAMFRLGDKLSMRLPRRQAAAKLIEHEQTWLPQIANNLAIAVPTPYRIGKPTSNYPWRWSILPWLEGITADREPPNTDAAELWGAFLRSLHTTAPANAPHNPVRGVPLKERHTNLLPRMQRLERSSSVSQTIKNMWYKALDTPIDVKAKWLHGDLHPGNILAKDGDIVGVIDWGDLTAGDVATDLASIWMLFPGRTAREKAISRYGNISHATLLRAKGWAIYFGITLLDVGLIDNPRQAKTGTQTLRRVTEDG